MQINFSCNLVDNYSGNEFPSGVYEYDFGKYLYICWEFRSMLAAL